jgi:hypothetical protein
MRNMSRKLINPLIRLIVQRQPMEEENVLKKNYTKKDLQEALLVKDDRECLLIHLACKFRRPARSFSCCWTDTLKRKRSLRRTIKKICTSILLACTGYLQRSFGGCWTATLKRKRCLRRTIQEICSSILLARTGYLRGHLVVAGQRH